MGTGKSLQHAVCFASRKSCERATDQGQLARLSRSFFLYEPDVALDSLHLQHPALVIVL